MPVVMHSQGYACCWTCPRVTMQETEHQLPRRLQRAHLWKLSSLALLLITAGAGSGLRAVHTPLYLDVTEATNVAFGLEGKVRAR